MGQVVVKWGNSLALRIPAVIARQMEIEEGAELDIRLEGKRLIVERAETLPNFSSDDLVRALSGSDSKVHEFGRPRGKEEI